MSFDRNLSLELVRATEAAALACAPHIGAGDEEVADRAAVEAMHSALNRIDMDGVIVIGEGEREDAPALYVGERVGTGHGPRVELAIDALEGTTLCATGGPNALSAIAAAQEGGFLRVPETYMDKIAVGPAARGVIDIDKSPSENLRAIAGAIGVPVAHLTVLILDRPRHDKLIAEVRAVGARIRLIKHGDVSAAIATCNREQGVDVLLGVGGAREGVITAAALACRGGDMQARIQPRSRDEAERARARTGIDIDTRLTLSDLARSNVVFAATGVTTGDFLKGVRYRAEGVLTHSVVMRSESMSTRWIEAEHNERVGTR